MSPLSWVDEVEVDPVDPAAPEFPLVLSAPDGLLEAWVEPWADTPWDAVEEEVSALEFPFVGPLLVEEEPLLVEEEPES